MIEPLADGLLIGFDSDYATMVDAVLGGYSPSGRLPITFPIDADAIAVDEDGRCASPQRCAGLREGTAYGRAPLRVYLDADGNRYEPGHGMTYDVS